MSYRPLSDDCDARHCDRGWLQLIVVHERIDGRLKVVKRVPLLEDDDRYEIEERETSSGRSASYGVVGCQTCRPGWVHPHEARQRDRDEKRERDAAAKQHKAERVADDGLDDDYSSRHKKGLPYVDT